MALTEEFFRSRIRVDESSGCWIWTGCKIGKYGAIGISKTRRMRAHRWSVEHFKGVKIPSDMDCCHTCDVPLCVNPDHLFIGTRADNMQDAAIKGRLRGKGVGEYRFTSELAREAVALYSKGMPAMEIAKSLNVSRLMVSRVVKGRMWQHATNLSPGGIVFPGRSHCKRGHLFTEQNTISRSDGRRCRICQEAGWKRGNVAMKKIRASAP